MRGHQRLMSACLRVTILYALLRLAGLNRELGISNEFFVLGDSVVLTVLAQVSFMGAGRTPVPRGGRCCAPLTSSSPAPRHLSVLAQVSFMPILVLAARLCPEVGATLYP